MDWISLIVIVFIVLKTISEGGDWFDIMQGHAIHENRWASRQFDFLFGAIGVSVIALFAFLSLPEVIASANTPTQRAAISAPAHASVAHRKAPLKVSARSIARAKHSVQARH